MNELQIVRVYSCLAETSKETSCLLIEVDLKNGTTAEGKMTAQEARALAQSLIHAARRVEATSHPLPAFASMTRSTTPVVA